MVSLAMPRAQKFEKFKTNPRPVTDMYLFTLCSFRALFLQLYQECGLSDQLKVQPTIDF